MSSLINKLGGKSRLPDDPGLPPTKRISTPAGQRLSTILELSGGSNGKNRASILSSGRKTPLPEYFDEEASKNSAFTTTSVWSESAEKVSGLKSNKLLVNRGGWKRLALIVVGILAILIALIVGLVVGLKKKSSSASATSSSTATSTATAAGSVATIATPANFPLGSYSFVTFLDSSYTDCTSNAATWTCYPYTDYYTSPSSALSVFNWVITKKAGSNSEYQISSTDNPFSLTFTNEDLSLSNAGTDSEHYSFQMSMSKKVSPSSSLTDDNSAVSCYFNQTTFQAYLYTRQASTYPNSQVTVTGASYTTWPYRARVEQVAGGGQNVPNCYKVQDGVEGERVDLNATDASSLCSCLYKNWVTPT